MVRGPGNGTEGEGVGGEGEVVMTLWKNVACTVMMCGKRATEKGRRTFKMVVGGEVVGGLNGVKDAVVGTFFDVDETGSPDLMILTDSKISEGRGGGGVGVGGGGGGGGVQQAQRQQQGQVGEGQLGQGGQVGQGGVGGQVGQVGQGGGQVGQGGQGGESTGTPSQEAAPLPSSQKQQGVVVLRNRLFNDAFFLKTLGLKSYSFLYTSFFTSFLAYSLSPLLPNKRPKRRMRPLVPPIPFFPPKFRAGSLWS